MAADPLWTLDHVSLAPTRLRDVALVLRPGVTAVIGWSGAGKTSLLNVLVGFEKADRGSVSGPASIAWVPQDRGLWPHCTAREHLTITRPSGDGLNALLAAFDLSARADARPHELSQGEQARLSVARALAAKAAVLVMDEPLAHVDPARAGNYWRVIREHLATTGASLVFSTHLPEIALGEAEGVVCLSDGRVVHHGPVRELYDAPPTPELMTFLGPGNWFTPAEAALWLGAKIQHPRCFRPEQIVLTREDAGAVTVESSRFRGSVADVELHHMASGTARSFFHRPGAEMLRAGMRVRAALLGLLVTLFVVTGCQRAPQAIDLTATEWRVWNLPPDGATLPTPRSVAVGNDGEIATLDTAGRVLIYDGDGALKRQWQMLDVRVGKPEGIVVLKDGRVVVCDTHYHRVVWFDANGHWLKNIGAHGKRDGEFIYPVGICTDAAENLYVCEYGGNDRVQKFSREGKWLASFGSFGTGVGQFQRPSGLTWKDGRLYVADAINNRVLVFSDDGKYLGLLGEAGKPLAFNLPYDIATGGDGALYVVEYGAGRLSRVSTDGRLLGQFGRTGSGEGEFGTPWGLAVDAQNRILVADTKNRRIVTLRL